MGKVVRLTESDLIKLVKRVINEQEDVLGNIKDLLNNNGVDTSDMDDEEVLYELTSLMRTTNNKRLKHELTKLYYDFNNYYGNRSDDVQDFPEPESRKMKRRSVPNPRFYSDYDDNDENLDFLSDTGISRPKY